MQEDRTEEFLEELSKLEPEYRDIIFERELYLRLMKVSDTSNIQRILRNFLAAAICKILPDIPENLKEDFEEIICMYVQAEKRRMMIQARKEKARKGEKENAAE